jgi:hypothetical protein
MRAAIPQAIRPVRRCCNRYAPVGKRRGIVAQQIKRYPVIAAYFSAYPAIILNRPRRHQRERRSATGLKAGMTAAAVLL